MQNLDLVRFALKNMNGKEMRAISDSFSPTFTFSTPRFKSLNLEQYCEYIDFVSTILELNVKNIQQDGEVFTIKLAFNIVDNSSKYQNHLAAVGRVIMQDNLIQSLTINYKPNPRDAKIIMNIAMAIAKHFKKLIWS